MENENGNNRDSTLVAEFQTSLDLSEFRDFLSFSLDRFDFGRAEQRGAEVWWPARLMLTVHESTLVGYVSMRPTREGLLIRVYEARGNVDTLSLPIILGYSLVDNSGHWARVLADEVKSAIGGKLLRGGEGKVRDPEIVESEPADVDVGGEIRLQLGQPGRPWNKNYDALYQELKRLLDKGRDPERAHLIAWDWYCSKAGIDPSDSRKMREEDT